MMEHVERFYTTVARKKTDRMCSFLGMPTKGALDNLCRYFRATDMNELLDVLDDDLEIVNLSYGKTNEGHIATSLYLSLENNDFQNLNSNGVFKACTNIAEVDDFYWPDLSKMIDVKLCQKQLDNIKTDRALIAGIWFPHFQLACSAFGMEEAFIKMYEYPQIFKYVIDKITDFFLDAGEIYYSLCKDKIHGVLIGNDFGTQRALMISPALLKQYVLPGTKKFVDQAKSYGLKVMHHSCGAISEIIPELINIGVDIIHPMQVSANGMEPLILKKNFGNDVAFCGGVDTQDLLVNASEQTVFEKVKELISIFGKGLIVSPSHEAILQNVKPQNIEAMYDAIKHN